MHCSKLSRSNQGKQKRPLSLPSSNSVNYICAEHDRGQSAMLSYEGKPSLWTQERLCGQYSIWVETIKKS